MRATLARHLGLARFRSIWCCLLHMFRVRVSRVLLRLAQWVLQPPLLLPVFLFAYVPLGSVP